MGEGILTVSTPDKETARPAPWREYILVGILSALFALSFGVHYGVNDQNAYFLRGLHLSDGAFLENDWYVTQALQHHEIFALVVRTLAQTGNVAWSSAAFHLMLMVLFAVCVYASLRSLYPAESLTAFTLALVLLHSLSGRENYLSHPFLVPWLLPTGMATVFFAAGSAAYLHAKEPRPWIYAISGICFGLSGILHGTFLLLIPLFLGMTLLFEHRTTTWKTVTLTIAPFSLLTAFHTWGILRDFVLAPGSVHGMDPLLRLRVPHHYLVYLWPWETFLPLVVHVSIGLMGWGVLYVSRSRNFERATAIMLSLLVITCALFLLTRVLFVPAVGRMEAYRFAALLGYWGIVLFAAAWTKIFFDLKKSIFPSECARWIYLLIGIATIYSINTMVGWMVAGMTGVTAVFTKCPAFGYGKTVRMRSACVIAALIFTGTLTVARIPTSNLLERAVSQESGLYEFVRLFTPKEAVFIVPLSLPLQTFRIQAGRAAVVDWKGFPVRIEDSREWYRRICAVSGLESVQLHEQAVEGYRRLDAARAIELSRDFGATHVVVETSEHVGDMRGLVLVRKDDGYALYHIPERTKLP